MNKIEDSTSGKVFCEGLENLKTDDNQIHTQLVRNLVSALGVGVDDFTERESIIQHFKNAGISFIADIAPPMEQMYDLIYESRKRDLTQLEKVKMGRLIDKIQNTTKAIYTQKNPNATKEEKAAFSQNFIDTSKTYTQTKFLCELCGIEPERGAQTEIDKS